MNIRAFILTEAFIINISLSHSIYKMMIIYSMLLNFFLLYLLFILFTFGFLQFFVVSWRPEVSFTDKFLERRIMETSGNIENERNRDCS